MRAKLGTLSVYLVLMTVEPLERGRKREWRGMVSKNWGGRKEGKGRERKVQ